MYKLTQNPDKVIKLPGSFTVQSGDEGLNSDWDEYQEWLKAGNKPLPADPTPVVRDLAKEIDELEARIAKLEVKNGS